MSVLGECISGMILYDETIRQQKKGKSPATRETCGIKYRKETDYEIR
jgi:fructose-bisphosphate aldolase class 1